MSLDEASRQLEQAIHDAQVAFDCIGLGHIDRAHTNALTARTAADAAENVLRHVLTDMHVPPDTED
jgi:predicted kinase